MGEFCKLNLPTSPALSVLGASSQFKAKETKTTIHTHIENYRQFRTVYECTVCGM